MGKVNKIVVFTLLVIAACVSIFFYQKNPQSVKDIKDLFFNKNENSVINAIKKEIDTPGALFAKIESAKAFLSNSGVFSFTNAERKKAGLPLFASNRTLDTIARARLDDMFAKGYFEHVSPEGQSASTVAEQYGYEYISIGENIALGNFENDQVLVDAWMNSPGHRANILNKKFTSLGVAVGKGIYKGKSTWIGVQIFARPLSLCTKIDETLKNQIDSENTEVSQLQTEITNLGVELQAMQKQGRYDRDVYNQKVDEYNALAKDINAKITNLKLDIATYNAQVRSFNSCISSE
jgi:uncharacterized protein YkwD